jgi:hypothetical protein
MSQKTPSKGAAKRSLRNNALVMLVAGLGILVLANVLFTHVFGRVDLTEYRVNTLSEASVAATKELGDFEVKVFLSPDLPETLDMGGDKPLDLRGVRTRFLDKLNEYRSYSDGRLRLTLVTDDVTERAKKAKLQLFSGKNATVEKGLLKFSEYVIGATFHYKNAIEAYPLAINPEFYEYEITKILVRLKEKAARSVEMKDELEAGQAVFEAAEACRKAVDEATQKADGEAKGGLAALLMSKQESEETVERLRLDRDKIDKACEPVASSAASARALAGRNEFLDVLAGYADELSQVYVALKEGAASSDEQLRLRSVKAAQAVKEIFGDVDKANDDLKNAPGKRSVGILCGHGEFCPFPSDKPLIQPEIGQLLGQKNPFISQFVDQAKRIEEYVNRINEQINKGVFKNRGIEIKQVEAGKPIPADVAALVVFGPTKPIPEKDWYFVDQFLLSGKSVVVLADQFDTGVYAMNDEQEMTDTYVRSTTSNVSDYLKAYGIEVKNDLVYDARSSDRIVITQIEKQGQFQLQRQKELPYPAFPVARGEDLAEGSVLVQNLPALTLPYASSLKVSDEAAKGGQVTYEALITSSADAVSMTSGLDVDPARLYQNAATFQSNGPHTLAVLAHGNFTSWFKGKPTPAGVDAKAAPEAGQDKPAEARKEFAAEARKDAGQGRLLVIGTNFGLEALNASDLFAGFDLSKLTSGGMDFLTDLRGWAKGFQNWQIMLGQKASFLDGTIAFIENVFDWAIQNDALVAIRTKFYDRRPLVRVAPEQEKLVQYGVIVGLPVLFALYGLLRWKLRRGRIQRKVAALLARKEA